MELKPVNRYTFFILLILFSCGKNVDSEIEEEEIPKEFTLLKGNVGGYMITQRESVDETYNAGYSMYAAAWPLLKDYPGRKFQSGH